MTEKDISKWHSRKFIGFIVTLVLVAVCAFFEVDISVAAMGLYGLYCGSNVLQKKQQ